ncbi:MAG: His-Xaa-Ser system radical SAM maturase HxsC [Thermodesulfobacteriota bacterium]
MPGLTHPAPVRPRPLIGVITTRLKVWSGKQPLIFLARTQADLGRLSRRPWVRRGLAALLVSDNLDLASIPTVNPVIQTSPEQCGELKDGDVVLINPAGGINLLYQADSPHNSILATNRCNCLCVMCPQVPGDDPPDLLENNLKLISLVDPKRTENLGITGGEPTLLGEDLIKLVRAARQKLPNTLLTLLTNGRKLKDLEFAKALVQVGFPNLFIEIPLFADNDTEHDTVMGAKGSFYDTLQGLHNLALLGQPVGLRTVLHALTISRLRQYAEFVYRNLPFVMQVAFMGMETCGLAGENLARLWVDPYDYRHDLAYAVRYLDRRMVPVSIYNHQLCILPPEIWRFARKSITTWKQTYLPLCHTCRVQEACGGLFATGEKHSAYLRPVG